jgi:hypothetical protein
MVELKWIASFHGDKPHMNPVAAFYCQACGLRDLVELLDGETPEEFGLKIVEVTGRNGWQLRPTSDVHEPLPELWCGECQFQFAAQRDLRLTPEAFQKVKREKEP